MAEERTNERARRREGRLPHAAVAIGALLVLMWAALFANLVSDGWLTAHLGIWPRHARGLIGVPFAPFLHTGIAHTATSSLAFAMLSAITIFRHGLREFALVSLSIVLLGGLGVWLVGRNVAHVGASGWMAGLLGFLLVVGVRQLGFQHGCPPRRVDCSLSTLQDLAIAACAVFVSSSLLWGRAPAQAGVSSWELYLCSLAVGCVAGELRARHVLALEGQGAPVVDKARHERAEREAAAAAEAAEAGAARRAAAAAVEGREAARHQQAASEWSRLRGESSGEGDDEAAGGAGASRSSAAGVELGRRAGGGVVAGGRQAVPGSRIDML